eukprot:6036537-Amphidinium_carterae.1
MVKVWGEHPKNRVALACKPFPSPVSFPVLRPLSPSGGVGKDALHAGANVFPAPFRVVTLARCVLGFHA